MNIEKYKENNRIEAKKALGGLPQSIWETYSAFANTLGGVILLGVEEYKDKSLHPINLPNPEILLEQFWKLINDKHKVSVNILSVNDVTIENIEENRIIMIRVPRAQRIDQPVYIDGNPFTGSYRRSGEGDYRCSFQDVQAMTRDAAIKTQDMTILENNDLNAFCFQSINKFRNRFNEYHPNHPWVNFDDVDFLYIIGAIGKGTDGKLHPTSGGLLLFGCDAEIKKEFPGLILEYKENICEDSSNECFSSDNWKGNVLDFCLYVSNRITKVIKINDAKIDKSLVYNGLKEALANCLINADYYSKQKIVITMNKDSMIFSNPGRFRIDLESAKRGGISDPRNRMILKCFSLIEISEGVGGGIPNIINIWKKNGWTSPLIMENFNPDQITVKLIMKKSDKITNNDKNSLAKATIYKQVIINYLTENITANIIDIEKLLGLSRKKTEGILLDMVENKLIIEDDNHYRLMD